MDMIRESSPRASAATPLVSVLIPTYQYARYLPEAIESALAQDLRDFELIISDDHSTDSSAETIRHYENLDPRIRAYVHTERLGMVQNWNWCLQQARGRYVKFLFGDDRFASKRALSRFVNLLERNPSATLASSARILIDEQSRPRGAWNELTSGLHCGAHTVSECLKQRHNFIGEPSAVMFRRADATRGFDPSLKQIVDLEMWFRLLLRGDLVHTSEPLCSFRQHDAQQTVVNNRSRVSDRELQHLISHYLDTPSLQPYLGKDSFARRRILHRQIHYLKKSGLAADPEFCRELSRLRAQLRWPWSTLCWTAHRLSRPYENMQRKFRNWRAGLSASLVSSDDSLLRN